MTSQQEMDEKWLRRAYRNALRSPDPSTQNGAVLVSAGNNAIDSCNEFPYGVKMTSERLEDRDLTMQFIEHAERNAIFQAAFSGVSTRNTTLYCEWFACTDCARAIICSGITRVVGHQQIFDATPDRWKASIDAAFEMFSEAGVVTDMIDVKLNCDPILFNGGLWYP
jgi:dCMP deaminase